MITMFDAIDVSLIPSDAQAVAGYTSGRWPTYGTLVTRFPRAHVLSIAIDAAHDADCLDIEQGDAVPEQAAGWTARQLARGITRPCLYASVSVMPRILGAMRAAGVSRGSLRLWSAHYGNGEHICGPASCREVSEPVDGTQWTDNARGMSLDQSLLADDFFGKTVPADPAAYLTPAEMSTIMNMLPVLREPMTDASLPHSYVRRLQAILQGVYGFYKGPLDGMYGPGTAAAVKALQGHYSLAQDSVTGPLTWAKVIEG